MKSILISISCLLLTFGSFAQDKHQNLEKKRKKFLKKFSGWAHIPKGHITISNDSLKLGDFYMLKTEITNIEWQEYLYQVKQTKGEDAVAALLPDTALWISNFQNFAPYATHYHKHPAYHYFPVVNISYQQALDYCQWLENFLNNQKDKKYKSVKVRMPSRAEWIYAASAGQKLAIFPWEGLRLIDKKGHDRANYYKINQLQIGYDSTKNTKSLVIRHQGKIPYDWISLESPQSAESYQPNAYGLYGMAGNVAEFVAQSEETDQEGIIKGGSWADPAYFLQVWVDQSYQKDKSASPLRGFRPIMEVKF